MSIDGRKWRPIPLILASYVDTEILFFSSRACVIRLPPWPRPLAELLYWPLHWLYSLAEALRQSFQDGRGLLQ